jgi:hypothetical protein
MHISSPKKGPQKVKRRKWRRKNCTLATPQGRTERIFHILAEKIAKKNCPYVFFS